MKARLVLAVAIAVSVSISGCVANRAAPADPDRVERPIGQGLSADGPWTAWTYLEDGSLCLEFRWADGRGDGSCTVGAAPFVTRDPKTTYVIGGTKLPEARTVRLRMEGRESVSLGLVLPEAGVSDGVRYYAASLGGGPVVTDVDVLDQAGRILETHADRVAGRGGGRRDAGEPGEGRTRNLVIKSHLLCH